VESRIRKIKYIRYGAYGLLFLGAVTLVFVLIFHGAATRTPPHAGLDDELTPPSRERASTFQGGGVLVNESQGSEWDCRHKRGCDCVDGYLQFLEMARAGDNAKTEDELKGSFRNADEGRVAQESVTPKELADRLVRILNVDFFWDNIESELLHVTIAQKREHQNYFEQELLLSNEYVGTWRAILLLPKGPGPHPAIVALHGHGDSPESFRDRLFGKDYPAHGYAILIPAFRLMCGGASEGKISKELLLHGHSLLGVRCYETLLAVKFLLANKAVDSERLGLIGHSGGSALGNLVFRIDPRFRACVTDNVSTYHRSVSERGGFDDNYFDDMLPGLFPLHEAINDFENIGRPVFEAPYGYRDPHTNNSIMPRIFDFFDDHVREPSP